tara:strand:+ start:1334 stop:1993 length:660 start_codon:yes stop_codon:yes gene_type:complete
MKKKNLKIAIDSPAASGAGTQAKLIAKKYKLLYLDTGKLYRILGKTYLKNNNKINYSLFKKKISKTKIKDLSNKNLLNNEVGMAAAKLAKIEKIRKFVNVFQKKLAKKPPKKYNGVCFDGRDITYNIIPDADVKLFLTASLKTRAKRRYKELKKLNHKVNFKQVYDSIKERDNHDFFRKVSPLKKTKDSIKIDSTDLSINSCFNKINKIIKRVLSIKYK